MDSFVVGLAGILAVVVYITENLVIAAREFRFLVNLVIFENPHNGVDSAVYVVVNTAHLGYGNEISDKKSDYDKQ